MIYHRKIRNTQKRSVILKKKSFFWSTIYKGNSKKQEQRFGILTVSPSLLILLLLMLFPLVYNFIVSTKYLTFANLKNGGKFVGLSNFIELFQEPEFLNSLLVTFIYVFLTVSIELIVAFSIALLVYRKRRWLRSVATIGLLLPKMVTPVSAGLVWRFMLNYETGIINYFLTILHLPRLPFLTDPVLALGSLIVIGAWQHQGFDFLLILAGLMSIPNEMLEASKIDGASNWRTFIHVIIPVLRPVLGVVILFGIIYSFQVFDIVYMTTGGGPAGATQVIGVYLYRKLFLASQLGVAASISVIILFISLAITFYMIYLLKREEL